MHRGTAGRAGQSGRDTTTPSHGLRPLSPVWVNFLSSVYLVDTGQGLRPLSTLPFSHTRSTVTSMSSAYNPTSISSSTFETIFSTALAKYAELTGKELLKDPLADQIQSCSSPAAVLDVLRRRAQAFREFRNDDSKLMRCLSGIINGLHTLFTSSAVSGGASLVSRSVCTFSITTGDINAYSLGIPTRKNHLFRDWHPSLGAYLPSPHTLLNLRYLGLPDGEGHECKL